MRQARRYVVSGRVTGVGFRFFTQDRAQLEGIAGCVRNLPDGRVEVVAEGEAASLERFERALHGGPSRARVGGIETTALPVTGSFRGFTIDG